MLITNFYSIISNFDEVMEEIGYSNSRTVQTALARMAKNYTN